MKYPLLLTSHNFWEYPFLLGSYKNYHGFITDKHGFFWNSLFFPCLSVVNHVFVYERRWII